MVFDFVGVGLMVASCSSDEEITQGNADNTLVSEAKSYLKDEIILSTKATLSGVDKTLLPEGCPTKFNFFA